MDGPSGYFPKLHTNQPRQSLLHHPPKSTIRQKFTLYILYMYMSITPDGLQFHCRRLRCHTVPSARGQRTWRS